MMKEGKIKSKLSDICKIINGRAYLKPEMLPEGKYRILRVGNFFTNEKWYYSDLELEYDKYCENGDLLYAWSASFGPHIWKGEKVIYHYHIWKIECTDKIDKFYLYYWLDSDALKRQTLKNLHGATMNHITKKIIENCVISYPPLSEQKEIVEYLDSSFAKIDTLKANAAKNLDEAKALFQSALKEALEPKKGWEEKTLKDICKVINGRAYSKDEMLKQGKYRLLRVGNFFTNDSWYYSDLELEEDKYCDKGDLLYAWSASFGPRIWDGEKVIYHYHIWKMVCSTEIDKYFLCYWLDSDELKKQTMTNLHGATMAHITKGIIEAAHVVFPPLSEQQEIVSRLDSLNEKVNTLQQNYSRICSECDALKQAILRQVFE